VWCTCGVFLFTVWGNRSEKPRFIGMEGRVSYGEGVVFFLMKVGKGAELIIEIEKRVV
tara:strand:- start:4208 stop:4381 length:174 start_codon:yes stop_codon:yes gene_type:complete